MVGVVGLGAAFMARSQPHFGWRLASAAVALTAGVVLLFNPLIGAASLALLIGVWLVVNGICLLGLGLRRRKHHENGWGWVAGAGVFELILAAVILGLGAVGATVLVGIIVGVDLIVAGFAVLALHRAAGRSPSTAFDTPPS